MNCRTRIPCEPYLASIQSSRPFFINSINHQAIKSQAEDAAGWHMLYFIFLAYSHILLFSVSIVSTAYIRTSKHYYSGVYWNDNDPMNIFKSLSKPDSTLFHASIEAI